jgi:Cu+-exporting ATPase
MDSLIAMGSAAALVYGIFAIFRIGYGLGHNDLNIVTRYSKDLYFESAAMILALITLGKLL